MLEQKATQTAVPEFSPACAAWERLDINRPNAPSGRGTLDRTNRMKTLICYAAALFCFAAFGSGAQALQGSLAHAATPGTEAVKVDGHVRRHRGLFSNWCAYNCYAVPRCSHGRCLGIYGYSRYAYDADLPFRYRYDRDATPSDNVLGMAYPVTGEPYMRLFERIY